MANLGNISVTFLANTAGFTGAIKAAAESLKTFGQTGQLAATAAVPLQSTLGGVGSAAAMTTGNMSRLGQSTIQNAASMKLLQAATAQGQTTLGSFGVNAGAAAGGMQQVATAGTAATKSVDSYIKVSQNAGESASAFKTRVEAGSAALSKQVPVGHEIKNSYRMMADGSLQASRTITQANNQGIMSMLSFKNMAGKIAHYISFSIGVQMVMGITRGIKSLVETMSLFQKEVVRTAGVAGRLGGAFKKTVADIGEVSKELGRNTIFKASEAAHAMYDLASAGFDVAGAMGSLETGVAAVGPILDYAAAQQIELADATASVSRALKMFDMDLDESMGVVDTFTAAIANSFLTAEKLTDGLRYSGAMANVLGISLNETVASLMSLSDAGLTGAQSGQRLNMIMTKLLKPTDKAHRTLAALGLTIEDISPQTHTLSEIFHTLEAAGFGAGEAANFFRARTAGAAAALISSADDMERYKQTLLGAEGITKELAERQEDTLWGSFKLVSAAVESLALKFGDYLMPVIHNLAIFVKGAVIPALEIVMNLFGAIGSIIKPVIPLLKWFAAGVLLTAVAIKVLTYTTKSLIPAIHSFTGALMSNPLFLFIAIVGLAVGALLGLLDTFGLLGPVMEGIGAGIKWVTDYLQGFSDRLFDTNNQQRKSYVYMGKLKDASNKYRKTLDNLIYAYDKQIDAQQDVDDLLQSESNNIEKLSAAKAKAANASEIVTNAEEKFYSAAAKLMQGIASLTEGLDLYVEALGKVGVAQDKIIAAEEDEVEIKEDIVRLNEELVDTTNRYGIGSQEVLNIENELYKKHKDLLDVGEEIIELGIEEQKELDDRAAEYEKLGEAEKKIADIGKDLIENEEKKKEAEIDMNKLIAKRNVLMSTRNNFERYFNERVNLLRDAEQKLYDIELKIYKLRHGAVDSFRDLFKALTANGMVSSELIETYKNMEVAEGSALKEHVEYAEVLDGLNDSNRRSVTQWTEAYIDALDDGMTEDQAFAAANKKMGKSISSITGLTADGIKEILEYAHAEHLARDETNAFRQVAMAFVNDLVDSGQATVEQAAAMYAVINNANELEDAYYDLAVANDVMDDSMRGLIKTTGLLLQWWLEFGNVGEDIGKITVGMVNNMGLIDAAGADEMSILARLNSFYKESRANLEDYDQAMIVAALSAIKWAETNEGFDPKTVTADQIVAELPIDDFSEFIAFAMSGISTLEGEFDGLADSINGMTDEISDLVDEITRLIGLAFPELPEPELSEWEKLCNTFNEIWRLAWKLPEGSEFDWSGVNIVYPEAKGLIAAARGISRTRGPTNALIGEAGAEAVVPLEGANRRFGKEILDEIIPKYFPDILQSGRASLQRGGEVNMPRTSTDYLRNSEETTEIHIHGDINVYNPNDMDDFMDEFLEQLGKKRRLKI